MIKKEKTGLLIDIAIPVDSKFNTREAETLRSYKDLVSMVWKVRTEIVPVIIGASGTIKQGSVQNLQLLHLDRRATETTEGHNNELCTQHLYSAEGNRFDLSLGSGLTRRPPLINNRRE
jgi:hypothetical protein